MENITLGQIATILAFLVGIIGSIEYLYIRINKLLDKKLQPIKQEINDNAAQSVKNHLVNYLALAEQDLLVGKQKENFYELYDLYTNKYHLNSYIHSEYERLHKQNKI